MVMQERSKSYQNYRFGFNGMEQDDEFSGSGNTLDFGSRIYNPRLGRWMSMDTRFKSFPDLTPYSFVENSPINAYDPNGESGVATVKRGFLGIGRKVVVESNLNFYGFSSSKVNTRRAKQVARNIEKGWNNANGSILLADGKTYKVKFKVKGRHLSQKDGDELRKNNGGNPKENFIRIVSNAETEGSSNSWAGNTGKLRYDDFVSDGPSNRTTPTHEYGHGLGWHDNSQDGYPSTWDNPGDHDFDGNVDPSTGLVTPGIMTPRSTPASQMTGPVDPSMIEADGTIDESIRQPNQRDIGFVFNGCLISTLSQNGQAAIGSADNQKQRPQMPTSSGSTP